ncbi:T7SS effector LXG polymorphic toxin [Terribacillus saccharophilus]|uniref:T7SS effector LXG polymorphic toxin n=1 Tax=Terribacillus saccharophilus TaxID=361277 RepID=UPI002989FA22|nr:T7SS effector LXG polymorphic toxin [Terribacillus saccharophilus]MCM3226123.1 LXG domain-containing protein [Terribacillus saccharophilus]
MNVIKVSEILPELDQSKKKKENEKEHVLELRDSLNKMISLGDAFKGNGADAIKDHLSLLHIPAVLMLNLFIENHLKNMDEVKKHILDFEEDTGFVNQDFLEQEVKTSIQTIEELAGSSIKDINKEISSVSDIIGMPQISLSSLTMHLDRANDSIDKTVEDLNELNTKSSEDLKKSAEELNTISDFVDRVASWESKGITLDSATIKEIDKYFADNETINKLVDSAVELSIKDGDATALGNVADWLDKVGKLNGGLEASKNALAATILISKRLTLVPTANGKFKVRAHPDWVQRNGKYKSKLADKLYSVLKKGSSSSISAVRNILKKYDNTPSNLLRHLVGFKPGTTTKSYGKLLEASSSLAKYSKEAVNNFARVPLDMKKTLKELISTKTLKNIGKKIPYGGTVFSIVTNGGEFFSDKNKDKSTFERGGRFLAGIGMDVGVAGLTTGGAAIGTMICPGVGTLIGGAIGASAGIVTSILAENKIKDYGEKAGKWVEEKATNISENIDEFAGKVSDSFSDAGNFVKGLFR